MRRAKLNRFGWREVVALSTAIFIVQISTPAVGGALEDMANLEASCMQDKSVKAPNWKRKKLICNERAFQIVDARQDREIARIERGIEADKRSADYNRYKAAIDAAMFRVDLEQDRITERAASDAAAARRDRMPTLRRIFVDGSSPIIAAGPIMSPRSPRSFARR